MPPEVRAAVEETLYNCESGNATISMPHSMIAAAPTIQDDLATYCPDMTFDAVEDQPKDAQIVISDQLNDPSCDSKLTAPVAFDATAILYSNIDGSSLNLNAEVLSKILTGEIADWSDPQISKINNGSEYSEQPIVLIEKTSAQALAALKTWGTKQYPQFSTGNLQAAKLDVNDYLELQDGEIAIVPASIANEVAIDAAGLVVGKNLTVDVVAPVDKYIASGASQFVPKVSETTQSLVQNLKLAPAPAPGEEVASLPYQMLYPIYAHVCETPTLVDRALVKYFARQSTQGAYSDAFVSPLEESVRLKVSDFLKTGLPKPVKVTGEDSVATEEE